MANVSKGQKIDLTKTSPGLTQLLIEMLWQAPGSIEVDSSAFLLGASGKTSKDEDLVFYGNPNGGKGSVNYLSGTSGAQKIKIILNAIPQETQKIAFTMTIYEAVARKQNFGQIKNIILRILNDSNQSELIRFDLGNALTVENSLVVGELYRHNGEWKFNAIGSGFDGGLAALCGNYGIDVKDVQAPQEKIPEPVKPSPPPDPRPNPNQTSKINLTKIELKKKGESINLSKGSGRLGEILVNLNWNQKPSNGGGFFSTVFGGSKSIDLDLACLYELKNGDKGVVQALGKSFGSFNYPPYVVLDGDDRTGAVSTGENLRINGSKLSEIRRLLIFTFIYEGVANWAEADGVVTLKQPNGPDIIVRLDEYDSSEILCAIALIENVNNDTFRIKRLVEFYDWHETLDRAYNWGMRWYRASK